MRTAFNKAARGFRTAADQFEENKDMDSYLKLISSVEMLSRCHIALGEIPVEELVEEEAIL